MLSCTNFGFKPELAQSRWGKNKVGYNKGGPHFSAPCQNKCCPHMGSRGARVSADPMLCASWDQSAGNFSQTLGPTGLRVSRPRGNLMTAPFAVSLLLQFVSCLSSFEKQPNFCLSHRCRLQAGCFNCPLGRGSRHAPSVIGSNQ